ncbi:hypothetical protein KKJ04_14815 [Xenorhabdus bovienii]|uniref:hypothetical protein n=1 Tax=Xenorhabdus bovienii TaxID=40576 RepID=UPI0023B20BA0|nr:hypothetical protein [Xenorhabdus bovienii]MDE9446840.1 hypothetical protein [Xenorhabdus bovienii]
MSSNNLTQKINDALASVSITIAAGHHRIAAMLEMNGTASFTIDKYGEETCA